MATEGWRERARSASRGDAAALDALLCEHLPGLIAFVRARAGERLRARDATMDLVQSACREVLRDLPPEGPQAPGAFRHWLYLAAERKLLDRARYHARDRRDAGREVPLEGIDEAGLAALRQGYSGCATPSGAAMLREELAQLEAALQRLSEEHREVLVLARIVGLSHAEIAARSGRSEGATRVLLHRALARLAREMRAAERPRGAPDA